MRNRVCCRRPLSSYRIILQNIHRSFSLVQMWFYVRFTLARSTSLRRSRTLQAVMLHLPQLLASPDTSSPHSNHSTLFFRSSELSLPPHCSYVSSVLRRHPFPRRFERRLQQQRLRERQRHSRRPFPPPDKPSTQAAHDAASPVPSRMRPKRTHSPPHLRSSPHESSTIRAFRFERQPQATSA